MKKLLCIIMAVLLMIPASLAMAFEDVPQGHWAEDYISRLSEKGIIVGYEDSTFRPDGDVTRAEFAKILCLTFDISDSGIEFDDVSGHWAEEYANISGSVIYTENSSFYPDIPIKRAEIAYALSGALSLPKAEENLEDIFTDSESVDSVLSERVAAAVQAGIIEGYENGEIKGNAPVTRAEACALIIRALEYKENMEAEKDRGEEETKEPEKEDTEIKEPEKDNSQNAGTSDLEHIYTLVPSKDLILITSARKTTDPDTQNDAIRLTYCLAGDETEYSSVILDDGEIEVLGARTSLDSISKGDIIITDSGFLRHIDRIFVLCALGDSIDRGSTTYIPSGSKIGPKGSDKKYEFICGKVESRKTKDKTVVVTLENGEIVSIPRNVSVSIYHPVLKSPWESASPTAIVPDNAVLFARYTDGVVTDAVVAIYE